MPLKHYWEKSTMEAHKPEKQFNYSLDELGSVVTSAMESSVAAAEFRALSFVDLDNWDVNDLETILDAKNILVKELQWIDVKRSLNQINQKQNVYLALGKDHAWVFSFDESTLKLSGTCTDKFVDDTNLDLMSHFDASFNEWIFIKCERKSTEQLAIIPGVEKHWFWSTIWTNRNLYLQSGLAALLTNIFALGVSLFSMIVYNRIIPSNAMNSLLVLVSGLLILMIVDYVIRNVRNRFLSIAGVDSDLTLADRLFAQVMDLQYKSRQGTVGSLANTLKEFEHIREFCFSNVNIPY